MAGLVAALSRGAIISGWRQFQFAESRRLIVVASSRAGRYDREVILRTSLISLKALPRRKHSVSNSSIPLDSLPPGRTAEISQLAGCPEHVQRLEEMGLREGTSVEMLRHGRPCIIRVAGYKLCFRRSDELSVQVRTPEFAS
jgi:Fe2+ transport system protein FeoA